MGNTMGAEGYLDFAHGMRKRESTCLKDKTSSLGNMF
jgi:hypothetical protein